MKKQAWVQSNMFVLWPFILWWGGRTQTRLSFFLPIVRHFSKQRRKPAPRGMASQHLQIFKTILLFQCLLGPFYGNLRFKWLRLNFGCGQIQGICIFVVFPGFYRFSPLFKYIKLSCQLSKTSNYFVSFHQVACSMVYIISVSSVPPKHKLYNSVKLNILIGLIMFICKSNHSCYNKITN